MEQSTINRFWAKVDKSGGDDSCWHWTAGKDSDGYGKFSCDGKTRKAHRIAWLITNGEIPDGLLVRHKCRGRCVNPLHLELGTVQDNVHDKRRDGTSAKKLTPEQVREIRARINETRTQLAIEYQVSIVTISHIMAGKRWAWLD